MIDCEGITQKLIKLSQNDSKIAGILAGGKIDGILDLKNDSTDTLIEVFADLEGYKYEIAHRKVVAEKVDFKFISSFNKDLAFAKDKKGQISLIDNRGEIIKKFEGLHIIKTYPFVDGSAIIVGRDTDELEVGVATMVHDSYYMIDKSGEIISGPYDGLHGTGEEHILAFVDEDQTIDQDNYYNLVYVRRDGTLMEDVSPITPFSENRAWIKDPEDGSMLNLIDNDFNVILGVSGVFATPMSCGRTWVNHGGTMYMMYDENGKMVREIPFNLASVSAFKDDRSLVEVGSQGNMNYVDQWSNTILADTIIEAAAFSEGVALVKFAQNDAGYYFIGQDGITILPRLGRVAYKEASSFSEGFACIFDDRLKKYYFIDHEGEMVLGGFDSAESFHDGVAKVSKNHKSYYIDHRGERVFGSG